MNTMSIGHRRILLRAALSLAVLVPLLAAAQSAAFACEARRARTHQAVPAGSLDNWEPVGNRAVLIWTRHSARAYLVSLDRRLDGLANAELIDLLDGDRDRIISACGHDGITVHGVTGGKIARIVAIERLSAKRTAELERSLRPGRPRSLAI